ncbi:MAG: shikimate 5-dehydrogenase [Gluconacetobacter diazotrophicus]|nr:shikimate 5-dehydrogenase [Gluconacetobacter diazotrophicus]
MPKPPIGRDTHLCMSLAGRPGSFGSRFHNSLYEQLELDYVYKAFTTADLPAAIGGIRALGIRGCSVSMPFKEAVIPLLDALAPSAAAIDSVNTITNDDGHLTGHNTDYGAVRQLVAAQLVAGRPLDRATRVVLRGSGGMAKAVAAALRDEGFADGLIVARNHATGPALARVCGYDWSPKLPSHADGAMLVNVSPLGMDGADADAMAFPEPLVAACALALDAVALPADTPFLRAAERLGRPTVSGAAIIVLQALDQFILYTGVTPTPEQVAIATAATRT